MNKERLSYKEISKIQREFHDKYEMATAVYKGITYQIEDLRFLAGHDGEPKWHVSYYYIDSEGTITDFTREKEDFFKKFEIFTIDEVDG